MVFNTDSGIPSLFLPADVCVVLCDMPDSQSCRLPLRTQMSQAWQILN